MTQSADKTYNPQEYVESFDARRYLREYYTAEELGNADIAIAGRLSGWLKQKNRVYETALEIGVGPVLEYPFSYSAYAKQIDLSDYLDSNLSEIQKWLDQDSDAHDWDPMFQSVLQHTAVPQENLEPLKAQFRSRVRSLLHCDLRNKQPMGDAVVYDLVTSFFCSECVAMTLPEWKTIKSRILDLVAPGGGVFFAAMRNCTTYRIFDKWFPAIPIDPKIYEELLEKHQFEDITATVHSCEEFRESGFDAIVLVSATRKANSKHPTA